MSIPNPKIILIKELNNMFYEFIWEDKPDKINRKQLTRGYIQGGLKNQGFKNILGSSVI